MRLYRGFDCGRSGAPVRDVMRAETHAHVLRLKKHLVTPGTALPADAGGLGAAEGLAQVTHVLAVDEAHAGLDGRCDAVRATEILAPDIAAEAVLDIVGLATASASSLKGIRHATGPKISSCAIRMRLSTSAKTVGQT